MGSRGQDYDEGIKANKGKKPPLSNAEKKIKDEGMDYPGLPDRGLSRSRYQAEARKAKDIMTKNIDKQIINDLPLPQPIKIRDIVEDKIPKFTINGKEKELDGGFFIDDISEKYLKEELGYRTLHDALNDIDSWLKPEDIYNMKYSDTYTPKIAGKTREGQLYEFTSRLMGEQQPRTYIKLMNIHTKSGKTYSIIMSVHEENQTENSMEIWNMSNLKQPRYNQ